MPGAGGAGARGRAMVPAALGFAAAVPPKLPHAPSPPRLRRSHAGSLFAWQDRRINCDAISAGVGERFQSQQVQKFRSTVISRVILKCSN